MSDFPDFSTPIWNRRDSKAKDAEIKYTIWVSEAPVLPGTYSYYDVFTVPAGKRYFISDAYGTTTFRGLIDIFIPGSHSIYTSFFEPYDSHPISLALPIPVESGEIIRVFWQNNDIVAGVLQELIGLWWEPGSKWEKPKRDDPLERFKLGDWNYANYILGKNGSFAVMFRRSKEDKFNYLKLEKPFSPKEKKVASFHLRPDEASEILHTTKVKCDKVKEVLNKYERKYNKIKAR